MRAVPCPKCERGTVTVVDSPIFVEEMSEPIKWTVVSAEFENGCHLEQGDIPERQP